MKKRWMICIGNKTLQAIAYVERKKQRIVVDWFQFSIEGEEAFSQTLKHFLAAIPAKIKRAELLLPFDLVFTKRMEVPQTVNRKQLLYAASMEFSSSALTTEQILAYREVGQTGTMKKEIMVSTLEYSTVEQYERAFRQAGIALTGISVPEDRVIYGAVNILKDTEHTLLVCIVEKESALLFILHQGRCYMQNRFRLTKAEREKGNVEEICKKLCVGKQFCTTHAELEKMEKVILIGLNEAERIQMEFKENKIGIPIQYFRPAKYVRKNMEEMPMLFFAMMDIGKNHMDFLEADKKNKVRTIEKRIPIIPGSREGMILLLCLFMLFVTIRAGNEKLRKELFELRTVSWQEEKQMQYYAELEREKQIEQLAAGIEEIRLLNQMLDLKEPDGHLLKEIETIKGAESRFDYRYSKKERILTFSCITDDYRNIPDYMNKLEKLSAFEEVLYTGYERLKSGKEYRFDVSCRMREGGGE